MGSSVWECLVPQVPVSGETPAACARLCFSILLGATASQTRGACGTSAGSGSRVWGPSRELQMQSLRADLESAEILHS